MKKTRMLLLGVLSTLCVTGCGNEKGKDKSTEKPEEKEEVDNNFNLINPEDTSQLTEKCKKYVDDMRAQEEANEAANGEGTRYMMNGCNFAPADEVKIDARDTDGSKIYRDDVDFDDESKWEEQSAQKSDRSKGVKLQFALKNDFKSTSYKIQVSTMRTFSENVIEMEAQPNTETCFKNLFQNTTYYWRVVSADAISTIKEFTTGDYPRWIECDRMFNIRDNGGYMTSSGKRVKQGLIFRGGEINKTAAGGSGGMSQVKHQVTISDAGKDIFRNVMKIGNELDLRGNDDLNRDNYHSCYWAEKDENGVDDIKFTNVALSSWEGILNNTQNMRDCFEAFAHADEAPVYYHCHGGADRTGTLGLFILGALGVSYSDIVIDYELTSYSSIIAPSKGGTADSLRQHDKRGTYYRWNEFIPNYLEKTQGWDKTKTLQDNILNYLVNVAKVPQATMDRYLEIMLED